MRLILLSASLVHVAAAIAQITITSAHMPSAGDTLHYHTTQAMGLNVDQTGAGMTWDFSTLTPLQPGADVARTVQSTPLAYRFYFDNGILYPEHQASYAMEGEDFSFQVITISNVFEFFKNEATAHRNVGFGANVNGIPTSVRRIPTDRIYQMPLEFGNVDSSFSTWALDVPGIGHLSQEQWRRNTVDGWGTLYLPADTFEVLRVRSVLHRRDSIFVAQFGTGTAINEPEAIEYKWLAQETGMPVLSITTVNGTPVFARYYREQPDVTGIAAHRLPRIAMHPNPADDVVHAVIPQELQGELSILDAQGRTLRTIRLTSGTDRLTINTSDLPAGVYTIQVNGDSMTWSGRFMVQH
jgi:hypothetical protein